MAVRSHNVRASGLIPYNRATLIYFLSVPHGRDAQPPGVKYFLRGRESPALRPRQGSIGGDFSLVLTRLCVLSVCCFAMVPGVVMSREVDLNAGKLRFTHTAEMPQVLSPTRAVHVHEVLWGARSPRSYLWWRAYERISLRAVDLSLTDGKVVTENTQPPWRSRVQREQLMLSASTGSFGEELVVGW